MKSPNSLSISFLAFAIILSANNLELNAQTNAQTYEYPFQNTNLSEDERLDNLISLMNVDEKITAISGQGVPRLGVPSPGNTEAIHGIVRGGSSNLKQQERPQGQRRHFPENRARMVNSTTFPQGYGLGETWDRDILHLVGEVMSYEARYYSQKSGRNTLCLWAPNADIGRDPRWGRTEECFGEDPFLVGELVAAETKGIQGDDPTYWRAAAVYKHFLANSNEDGRCFTSSDFGEDLFRDYYAYGFWRGVVKGGGRSLMCAYNKYNGVPCSTNDFIQNILVEEWGMDGMIHNDGGALGQLVTHHHYVENNKEAVKASLEAGVTRFLNNHTSEIKAALEEGMISEKLIDRNIKFNFRTMLHLGLLDNSEANPYREMKFDADKAPWETQTYKDKARLVSQKSVVLLKNENKLLPLDKNSVKKIAVIGNRSEEVLKDWYGALPAYTISPLDGIRNAVKDSDTEVRFIRWDTDGGAQKLAKWADVAIVCVGNHPLTSPDWDDNTLQAPWGYGTVASDGREALDRRSLQLETEDLIKMVWTANHNTIVALISSFPYTINWTQEHVPAIVHITQCSQELGNALADVIFGDYNPAGRTTQTWVKDITDLPNMLDYDIRNGRTYMYFKGTPLYPFGFGLSYTEFAYSGLEVKHRKDRFTVNFNLKNIGDRNGEEVVQLYVKLPGDDASKRLRGFERIAIAKGESRQVQITIPEEDLALWNMDKHGFRVTKGECLFMIGASSEDIRLEKKVKL
ncbi:MAG: glycoside hydrolase family 3 C-terminal domain-containing protein [Bacteroidales bacterium]|nr:glycoside hydrolase family 3 C-terminal domain-containing protein [Bacteroidales bacterium]